MTDSSNEFQYHYLRNEIGTGQALEPKQAFSQRLSFCINRLNLRDADVSRLTAIPKSAFTRYRRGESFPDARYIFRLAETLQINARWLITGEGSMRPAIEIDQQSDLELELLGAWRLLPDEDQKRVADMASRLIGLHAEIYTQKEMHKPSVKTTGAELKQRDVATFHSPTVGYRAEGD